MDNLRDAYRAIEDILGPEFISDDPAFMDSYAFQWLAELVRPNRSHYMPRPWAVAMPQTTRGSRGGQQGLQQVRHQDQADFHRLVSLGGADEGQRADAAIRPAPDESDSGH